MDKVETKQIGYFHYNYNTENVQLGVTSIKANCEETGKTVFLEVKAGKITNTILNLNGQMQPKTRPNKPIGEKKLRVQEEEKQLAKDVPLLDYLQNIDIELKNIGKEYCLVEHNSLKISNNLWYWYSEDRGGDVITFAMDYPNKGVRSYPEAVKHILEVMALDRLIRAEDIKIPKLVKEQPKEQLPLVLPEVNHNMKRAFGYLINGRGIDPDIVKKLVKENKIYESKEKHNVVFVGYDSDGNVKYANQRGTISGRRFVGDVTGSNKDYGFIIEGQNTNMVFVFESPIDAMSHATLAKMKGLEWEADTRISLGCVSAGALHKYLEEHPDTEAVILCLDNDKAGIENTQKIIAELGNIAKAKKIKNVGIGIEKSKAKDWNADLQRIKGIETDNISEVKTFEAVEIGGR